MKSSNPPSLSVLVPALFFLFVLNGCATKVLMSSESPKKNTEQQQKQLLQDRSVVPGGDKSFAVSQYANRRN